jgi:plasmid stabilization system protein ParE
LRGIAEYIALELKEPLTAQNLLASFGEAVFVLKKMPYRNALVRDERLASQYIVFYVVTEMNDSVTIIRILNGKREWNKLL